MEIELAPVRENRRLAPGFSLISLAAPRAAALALPGQFLHLRAWEGHLDPLLRRPFSIHRADREKGIVEILYQVVGRGTEILSRRRPGEVVDLLGPLGHGFQLEGEGKALLVAGGVGVAPLPFLAAELKARGRDVLALVGAKTGDGLLDLPALQEAGAMVLAATEDGASGRQGTVVDLLIDALPQGGDVFACGPQAMLRRVAEVCLEAGLDCQVSLDRLLACGSGACLGCAVRVKSGGLYDSPYARVCREGPVFPAGEVFFDS